jgi:hypothetical protein
MAETFRYDHYQFLTRDHAVVKDNKSFFELQQAIADPKEYYESRVMPIIREVSQHQQKTGQMSLTPTELFSFYRQNPPLMYFGFSKLILEAAQANRNWSREQVLTDLAGVAQNTDKLPGSFF